MNIADLCRRLLALTFTVFGLNGFLHFIPLPPPAGVAGQFMGALSASGYLQVVAALQLVAGCLLIVRRCVPLALALLGPIVANILLYHLLLERHGLVFAAVLTVLWSVLFYRERSAFAGLLCDSAARGEKSSARS